MASDRVRERTPHHINALIDRKIAGRLRYLAAQNDDEITGRIHDLDREWDVERALEANTALPGMTGLALRVFRDRRWLIPPALVLPFLLQHAVQGWCPPLEAFWRPGFRTRRDRPGEVRPNCCAVTFVASAWRTGVRRQNVRRQLFTQQKNSLCNGRGELPRECAVPGEIILVGGIGGL